MIEVGDLFEMANDDHRKFLEFISEIQEYGRKSAAELGFPEYFFGIEKKSPKSGVNYQVCLNEIPFPYTEKNGKDRMVANSIARIEEMGEKSKNHDRVYVYVNSSTYDRVRPPKTAIVKELVKDEGSSEVFGYDVYLCLHDGSAAEYLKKIIRYRMENFATSMPSFGCCDKYIACSDAKECLHSNPFYFLSCQYRKNLLAGRIFYGKNKNV